LPRTLSVKTKGLYGGAANKYVGSIGDTKSITICSVSDMPVGLPGIVL